MVQDRLNQADDREDRDYYGIASRIIRYWVGRGVQYLKDQEIPLSYVLSDADYQAGPDDLVVYRVSAKDRKTRNFTGRKAAREYRNKISKRLPRGEYAHITRFIFDSDLGLILGEREVW